jgi:hypothetical protein
MIASSSLNSLRHRVTSAVGHVTSTGSDGLGGREWGSFKTSLHGDLDDSRAKKEMETSTIQGQRKRWRPRRFKGKKRGRNTQATDGQAMDPKESEGVRRLQVITKRQCHMLSLTASQAGVVSCRMRDGRHKGDDLMVAR